MDLGNGLAPAALEGAPSAPVQGSKYEWLLSLWSRLSPAKWRGMEGQGLAQRGSCEMPRKVFKNTPRNTQALRVAPGVRHFRADLKDTAWGPSAHPPDYMD